MASPLDVNSPGLHGLHDSDEAASIGAGSPESYLDSIDVNRGPRPCQWRTPRFHDRECSRFFDCPSHSIERSLSDAGSVHEQPAGSYTPGDNFGGQAGGPTGEHQHGSQDDSDQYDTPSSTGAEGHSSQPEEDADRPANHPGQLQSNTEGAPGPAHMIQPLPQPRPLPPPPPQTQHGSGNTNSTEVDAWSSLVTQAFNRGQPALASQATQRIIRTPVSRERMDAPLPAPRRESVSEGGMRALPLLTRAGFGSNQQAGFGSNPQSGFTRHPQMGLGSNQQTGFGNNPQMEFGRNQQRALDPPPGNHQRAINHQPGLGGSPQLRSRGSTSSEWAPPRWQPDGEVTYCPICLTQFSFFVRKHHCRKCGRVVCNSCSPYRITIPNQFIVRPPGHDPTIPPGMLVDGLGAGYFNMASVSGGACVRLCKPCVADPNTAPPQSPQSPSAQPPRVDHQRSRSSTATPYGSLPASHRHGAMFPNQGPPSYTSYRARSVTMGDRTSNLTADPLQSLVSTAAITGNASSAHEQTPNRQISYAWSSVAALDGTTGILRRQHPSWGPRQWRPLARYGEVEVDHDGPVEERSGQVAEEDECPVCHRELPSRELENSDQLREAHIESCIQGHSASGNGTPQGHGFLRSTGMYRYYATDKDCVDEAECTICLEEFVVGVEMARLECLCRFHQACIKSWFVKRPGRCPVHHHDAFGRT